MGRLLVLFIAVPAIELILLIEIGARIGALATIGLIIATGVLGASLARWQGTRVLRQIQAETAQGRLPAAQLIDGLIILIAGALLITPGVLTDLAGFLCLVPGVRAWIRRWLRRRLERAAREGRFRMTVDLRGFGSGFGPPGSDGPREFRDVEPEPPSEPDDPPRRLE